jgi:hypothetical protein
MIMKFMPKTEDEGGSGGLRPHSSIDVDTQFIENLLIACNFDLEETMPRYIVLNVKSNMTVWELLTFIG